MISVYFKSRSTEFEFLLSTVSAFGEKKYTVSI